MGDDVWCRSPHVLNIYVRHVEPVGGVASMTETLLRKLFFMTRFPRASGFSCASHVLIPGARLDFFRTYLLERAAVLSNCVSPLPPPLRRSLFVIECNHRPCAPKSSSSVRDATQRATREGGLFWHLHRPKVVGATLQCPFGMGLQSRAENGRGSAWFFPGKETTSIAVGDVG